MNVRQTSEYWEDQMLSSRAVRSFQTRGRTFFMEPCPIRTEFQRDRDRILHCKAFRRLKHKTQMFLSPDGDHFRTRLTHTMEVSQIARTIARALRLNEDLTEAIALGHDLGHTPFGHSGERALRLVAPDGFRHNAQSLRVVEHLERDGQGLNLTWEVRDGILRHTGDALPSTLEGRVVRFSDRIAYINHDIDDALRDGMLRVEDLPQDCLSVLGDTHGARIDTMITDVVCQSMDQDDIRMSEPVAVAMNKLRAFMFERVYSRSIDPDLERRVVFVVRNLYDYFCARPDEMPEEYRRLRAQWGGEVPVVDYVAGMTDRYALKMFHQRFVPAPRN
nr:deoxyguanosinetriphosphate triphosphohydrolase [Maliibacterium massiliense]